MKITLSKEELRGRLRQLAGLEPERSDCSIEYTDGLDINGLLDSKLRAWYLNLLDTGDFSLLAPGDVASSVRCTDGPADGCTIILPAMCRRVADIRLEGWNRAATVLPATEAEATVRRQSNPFLAATTDNPVAVVAPGGAYGATGSILAWPKADNAVLLTAVIDPGQDSFILDEAALGGLENLIEHLNII